MKTRDLCAIAGISAENYRMLKARGFLPYEKMLKRPGKAEALKLRLLVVLSRFGIPYRLGKDLIERSGSVEAYLRGEDVKSLWFDSENRCGYLLQGQRSDVSRSLWTQELGFRLASVPVEMWAS